MKATALRARRLSGRIIWSLIWDLLEVLHCALGQGVICFVLVQPRKTEYCPGVHEIFPTFCSYPYILKHVCFFLFACYDVRVSVHIDIVLTFFTTPASRRVQICVALFFGVSVFQQFILKCLFSAAAKEYSARWTESVKLSLCFSSSNFVGVIYMYIRRIRYLLYLEVAKVWCKSFKGSRRCGADKKGWSFCQKLPLPVALFAVLRLSNAF